MSYCDGSSSCRYTDGPSWSGQKAMTSPGLACALMAAATALAWVRCVVTFWADETSPAATASATTIDPRPRVEQRRRPQGDQQQEGQEDHGGVARGERAGGDDAAGDGGEQRPQHHEADAAGAGTGAEVELDDAAAAADAEHGQRQHAEVDDREQPALVGRRLQRRALVVREAGQRVDHGREVRRCGPRRPRVLRLVEERRQPGHEEQAARGHRDQGGPGRRLGVPAAPGAHDGRRRARCPPCRRGRRTSTGCRAARPSRRPPRSGCPDAARSTARCRARKPQPVSRITSAYMRDSVA